MLNSWTSCKLHDEQLQICKTLGFHSYKEHVLQSPCICSQVRQHVAHKRTFLFLEQLILKHSAADQATNIRDIHEGIDFFFSHRAHGSKFIDFLQVRANVCCILSRVEAP